LFTRGKGISTHVDNQTTEHTLQACLKYSALREVIWPDETALQTKLYEPRPELERMARFAKQTVLDI
jgi:hypothetical protein